jgi:hypothetical protein
MRPVRAAMEPRSRQGNRQSSQRSKESTVREEHASQGLLDTLEAKRQTLMDEKRTLHKQRMDHVRRKGEENNKELERKFASATQKLDEIFAKIEEARKNHEIDREHMRVVKAVKLMETFERRQKRMDDLAEKVVTAQKAQEEHAAEVFARQ